MANLMDLLMGGGSGSGTGDMISMITKQVIGGDNPQSQMAAQGILSTLMSGMAKNASTPEGASALMGALDRDHDGSVLDDIMGMVSGANQSKAANGAGIIKHVLGNNSDNVFGNIAKASGLDISNVSGLAMKMAPLLMGALGRQKKESGFDVSSIGSFLSSSVKDQQKKSEHGDMFSKFIDQDGDGEIMDDIASMGMNILGKFLKK